MKEHGKFRIENGTITGPGNYMRERYDQFHKEITQGKNVSLKAVLMANRYNQVQDDDDMIYLRAIQLDYANWRGVKQLLAGLL